MLKKFFSGLIFGAGFTISFIVIGIISINYILPNMYMLSTKEPVFTSPEKAEIASPITNSLTPPRKYNFYNESAREMKIPKGGGIFTIAKLPTKQDAMRQRTFQMWLSETDLWQIRTDDNKPIIEQLPYPEVKPEAYLREFMNENGGAMTGRTRMTISLSQITSIINGNEPQGVINMNGKFTITKEGVLIFIPNPF